MYLPACMLPNKIWFEIRTEGIFSIGQKREGIGEGVDGLMDPYKLLIHYFSAVSSLI